MAPRRQPAPASIEEVEAYFKRWRIRPFLTEMLLELGRELPHEPYIWMVHYLKGAHGNGTSEADTATTPAKPQVQHDTAENREVHESARKYHKCISPKSTQPQVQHDDVEHREVHENARCSSSGTSSMSLHMAVQAGNVQECRVLLRSMADPNVPEKTDARRTPLMIAASVGPLVGPELCALLLRQRARVGSLDTKGRSALWLAVEHGDVATSVALIKNSNAGNVAIRNPQDGRTVLHLCTEKGNAQMIEQLMAATSDGRSPREAKGSSCSALNINSTDARGEAPLHLAVRHPEVPMELCMSLLRLHADPALQNKQGSTANDIARSSGCEDISAIAAGGYSELSRAALEGKELRCAQLIKSRAVVDARNGAGYGALALAALRGHLNIVRLLLDRGADPDTAVASFPSGESLPLLLWALQSSAIKINRRDLVDTLLQHKADPNSSSHRQGLSALAVVSAGGDPALCELLHSAHADVHAVDSEGRTALMQCAQVGAGAGTVICAGMLLQCQAVVGVQDNNGRSALAYAASFGNAQLCKLLLDNLAEPDAADTTGATPLILAVVAGQRDACATLLNGGARANAASSDGLTPALAAIRAGHSAILEFLIQRHASVHAVAQGWSALAWAAGMGSTGCVAALLRGSADPSFETPDGRSCLDLARAAGATEAEALIQGVELTGVIPGTEQTSALVAEVHRLRAGGNAPISQRFSCKELAEAPEATPEGALEQKSQTSKVQNSLSPDNSRSPSKQTDQSIEEMSPEFDETCLEPPAPRGANAAVARWASRTSGTSNSLQSSSSPASMSRLRRSVSPIQGPRQSSPPPGSRPKMFTGSKRYSQGEA